MKVYFKNLDGLRFIAAAMVILQHTSEYKVFNADLGLPNMFRRNFEGLGSYGVTLFFVLSGYLIFYLLFTEHKITNTVNVKNFYIRRMLRIWPLYLGFGILMILGIDYLQGKLGNQIDTPVFENLFYLFTFSINLQMLFAIPNKGIIELYWSVCIEEQFYLVAPWIVKKWANKLLYIIIGLIAIGLLTKFILYELETRGHYDFNNINPLYFFTLCRLDNFGIGALAAYIYFKKPVYEKCKHVIENKYLQLFVILFTLAFILNLVPEPWFVSTFLFATFPSVLFAFIILAASTGKFIFNLETRLLKSLGKYSYGIYVFHAVVSQVVLVVFIKYLPHDSKWAFEVAFPLASIVLSSIVAGLSYEIYEKRFLKLKDRFALIKKQ